MKQFILVVKKYNVTYTDIREVCLDAKHAKIEVVVKCHILTSTVAFMGPFVISMGKSKCSENQHFFCKTHNDFD